MGANASKTNGETNVGTTMRFSEIRSLRRVQRVEEGIGTDAMLDMPGIVHPQTGELLTVGDAVRLRILDVRTGRINTVVESKPVALTIKEAVAKGLVDPGLADRLLGPSGITVGSEDAPDGSKEQISLLEAIQRELYDAERGPHERVKVRDPIKPGKTITEAVKAGVLDVESGRYTVESSPKKVVELTEAFSSGKLITGRNLSEGKKKRGLSLSDTVDLGLFDPNTGCIVDRNDGAKHDLQKAVDLGLLDSNVREIVDVIEDEKITLAEALQSKIMNDNMYQHRLSSETLPYKEAKRRQLIVRPMTLKDTVDLEIYDDGRIRSPTHRAKISIIDSISRGVLDSDEIKCVVKTPTQDLLTLSEALSEGIIRPEGIYVDKVTGQNLSIPEAVEKGLITSVSVKSIFDIDCFKDTSNNQFLSLNKAFQAGVLNEKGQFIDTKTGQIIPFEEAVKQDLIRPEVLDMINRKIGMRSRSGRELTVFDAVIKNLIDPQTGNILERRTRKVLPLEDAVKQGVITVEGASLLKSLLSITLTTQTVTKTINRYSTKITVIPEPSTIEKWEDEKNLGAVKRKSSSPLKETLKKALDSLASRSPSPKKIQKDHSPTFEPSQELQNTADDKQVYELPPNGWFLSEAIEHKLFDPVTGLFIIPGTDRLVSFEECVKLEIINPKSALVVEPNRNKNISLGRALEKRILDATGHYCTSPHKKITMKEAIANNLVIFETAMDIDGDSSRKIQITKVSGGPDLVEVAERGTDSFKQIRGSDHETTPPEPLRVSKDIIFDSSTALVINTDSNQAKDIFEAIKDKEIELDKVLVKDPNSGKNMALPEAIKKGIVDENTGCYKDAAGRSIGFADAAKFGVIAVIGAPLVAAGKAVDVLKDVFNNDPSKTGGEVNRRRNLEDITEEINNQISTKTPVIETDESDPSSESILPINSSQRPMSPTYDDVFNESPVLSPGELTRGRVTTEPKYKVSIGRARSLSQSPDREGKPVILQKMRRKVVKPCEAVQEGLIDEATANILENFVAPDGESIKEAVETKIIDGNTGAIRDPQRGDLLTIKEALNRGLLDSSGSSGSNRLLIPVARSLSVPAVLEQGLYENGKIVHPETGAHLSLKEAITCDIVDPLSRIIEPGSGNELTLQEAIDKGAVDDLTSRVKTRRGSLDLLSAVKTGDFFEELEASSKLPPAGMTFSVALKRGLIDPKSKEVIHPITGYRKPIEVAIDDNFIMSLPGPISPDSISVSDALSLNLIDSANGVFIHPKTKDKIPISEAVETGLLILKPQDDVKNITIVTETVTKKTVEIDTGYEIDGGNIINLKTGEQLSVDEAVKRGIVKNTSSQPENSSRDEMEVCDENSAAMDSPLKGTAERILKSSSPDRKGVSRLDSLPKDIVEQLYDPETKKFRDPNNPEKLLTLEEAINRKIVDPVYSETLCGESSTIDPIEVSGQKNVKAKQSKLPSDINVKDAAKLGLLAVVGAPVLAGKAVFDAVKGLGKGKPSEKVEIVPSELSLNLPSLSSDSQKNTEDEFSRNREKVHTDRGSRKGLVEPESTMIKIGGKVLTFEHAVEDGIIDPKAGLIKFNNTKMKFEEALERGIMIKVKRPISIIDAVEKGICDEESGLFVDPATGEMLTLQEAIETNLIDPESVRVKDTRNPASPRTLTLKEAIEKGLIDGESGKVLDFNSPNVPELSLREAMDKGILLTKKPSTDKEGEKVIVPKDLKECTLGEAIMYKRIDPSDAVVKNPRTGGFKLVKEAIKDGLIDVDKNVIFESQNTKIEPLMVSYDNGTFTIFLKEPLKFDKAVADKHLDLKTGKFESPKSKEVMNLDESIIAGCIDPESVLIKDTAKTKLLKVPEAIRKGVMDSVKFNVVDTATSKLSSLSAALDNGLVTTQDLSLIDSLDYGLYNPTSGTFTDPFCSAGGVVGRRRLTLSEAIHEHLVDASTTVIKDPSTGDILSLNNAISSGLLDADIGRMNEAKTGKLLDLLRAKQRGYILPAETRR
ncbi:hypothetical protein LSTR_LSTR016777 [Laodelphax striatellus]|uniref:Microtubule-actin cross-linking factor 1 n=1 Tax=Laodelphax striatellus TaxID=195883 RepID=A0A482WLK2_LAOST|nr:hypothetical protein LSTR_LSTR016777 [Laodelphax striatellus]